jgi:hypothetical protein
MKTNLIHQSKNNLRIVCKPSSKFSPKRTKLYSCCRFRIARVPDHAPGRWLLGGVVVSHVIVWIQDRVGVFSDGYVVNWVLKVSEVLFCVRD